MKMNYLQKASTYTAPFSKGAQGSISKDSNESMLVKNICLLFLAFLLTMNLPLLAQSKEVISLNGTWEFYADNETTEAQILSSSIKWDTLNVPSNWDTRERYSTYVGKGYYKRTFNVPKTWKNKQIRLKFDAVFQTAKVWLNGELLGQHVGGYTPFEFNITGKNKKENTVIVMADNTYHRGAWWPWGGISRDVNLITNEDLRIVYQHIEAIPDFDKEVVDFALRIKVKNNSKKSKAIALNSIIEHNNKSVFSFESLSDNIPANSEKIVSTTISKPIKDFDLWHFDTPTLYELNTKLTSNSSAVDDSSDKFGIRKLEAKGERLLLNNEVVYMNGFNRVHDHPAYGNTEPDHLIQQDILDMMALGGRFSRMMHAPLSENILDFCDSVGYLIIEEIPVWGDDDPQTFKDNPLTKKWMKEMINRDYNHASVVGWSVGNELRNPEGKWSEKTLTKDQFEYINSMLDYIDELDTTRLKTYVSLTSYKKNVDITNEPFEKLDLLCINSYSDGVKCAKATHENFPGKPIFVSEIGKKQIGPAPQGALSDELVNQLQGLNKLDYVVGSSLWSYNDYRSNYKNTPASGFREWGVVDENRNPKKAYMQINQIYNIKKK